MSDKGKLSLFVHKEEPITVNENIIIRVSKTNTPGCKRYKITIEAPKEIAIHQDKNWSEAEIGNRK